MILPWGDDGLLAVAEGDDRGALTLVAGAETVKGAHVVTAARRAMPTSWIRRRASSSC